VSGARAAWRIDAWGNRRLWLVLGVAIVLCGAPSAASAAAGWSSPANIDSSNGITSVSCPTDSFCVAVDSGGSALIYSNGSWSQPASIDSNGTLTSVSCSSASYCIAVDQSGHAVSYDNGTWSSPTDIDTSGMGTSSVSCPASATVPAPFCVAVDISGNAVIDTNGTWGSPTLVDSNQLLISISCTSATFCTVFDLSSGAVTYNGTSWTAPVTIATGTFMSSVSCSSSSFCAAVGVIIGGGEINAYGYTWDGTSWSTGQKLSAAVGSFDESSVSCSSDTFCQAVYASPDAATFDGTSWTVSAGIDTQANLGGVSCPSQLFCEAVDFAGDALTYTGTLPVPVNSSPPTISGTEPPVVGRTLTDVNGTWSNGPVTYAYQWQDCDQSGGACAAIAGATNQSYVVQASDLGHTIRVSETASNAGGAGNPATSEQSGIVVPPVPTNVSLPSIGGTSEQGDTLTASHGSWNNAPVSYAYAWQRCDATGAACSTIAGAASNTYLLAAADVGHTIRVRVTALNTGGPSSLATSAQTAVVQGLPTPPPTPPTPPAPPSSPAPSPPTGPSVPATPNGATSAEVKSALSKVLAAHGKNSSIKELLGHGGYTFTFDAPSAGRLTISWYEVPKGAHLTKARKPVLVAEAAVTVRKAGNAKVKIKLTGAGRKLFKHATHMKLTAKGSFTPTGGSATDTTRSFTVKR
jgi:hypothetical protein